MNKFIGFVLIAFALVFISTGCTSIQRSDIEKAAAEAEQIVAVAEATAESIAAQVSTMPPGAEQDQLRRVAQEAQRVASQARTALEASKQALASIDSGSLDPALAATLGKLPYGGYIVAALGILLGVVSELQRRNLLGSFVRVVASVEEAFPDKDGYEKQTLKLVQGAKTTQLVEKVKKQEGLA